VLVSVLKIMLGYFFLLNRLLVFISSVTSSSVVNECAQVLGSMFRMFNVIQ